MKMVTVKLPTGEKVYGELHPGCYRQFPNGKIVGTVYLMDGRAVRVVKVNPKSTVFKMVGEVR